MNRLAVLVFLGLCLQATQIHAATITVHTTPAFTIEATNLYSSAYEYPNQAAALAAAQQFLDDGAAASGWGIGAFGGETGFQTQYLFFFYDSGDPSDKGVRLSSSGDQTLGQRTGSIQLAEASWVYNSWFNDQFLAIAQPYVSPTLVPEPGTAVLLGLGLAGLGRATTGRSGHRSANV